MSDSDADLDADRARVLDRLTDVIRQRRDERPEGSYVVSLLDDAPARPAAKVIEEAGELAEAATEALGAQALVHEAADLFFHALVLLVAEGVDPAQVWAELERRFGISGLAEKAARKQPDAR